MKEHGFSSRMSSIVITFIVYISVIRTGFYLKLRQINQGPKDSSVEELGKALDLPTFMEDRRAEIEAKLIRLTKEKRRRPLSRDRHKSSRNVADFSHTAGCLMTRATRRWSLD